MKLANSVTQTQTIGVTPDDWSQALSFDQFDPSLGELVGLTVSIQGTIAGTFSVENLAPTAQSATVSATGYISLTGPNAWGFGSLDFASADPSATANLGAYDGTKDFAGTSGTIVSGPSGSALMGDSVFLSADEAAAFTGTGTVALTAASTGQALVSGDPNLLAQSQIGAGAAVSLSYSYIPAGSGSDSGSVFTTAFYPNALLVPNGPSADDKVTTSQTITVVGGPTGWTTSVPVDRFDPSLGTLDFVQFSIQPTISGTVKAENLGATASWISVSETASVAVLSPTGGSVEGLPATSILSTTHDIGQAFLNAGYALGAYDGTTDFAGTSGTTVSVSQGANQTGEENLADPADLAAFTGTGSIDVPLLSSGGASVQGPAQALTETTQDTGATVVVSYVYTPGTATASGTAGSMASTVASNGSSIATGATGLRGPDEGHGAAGVRGLPGSREPSGPIGTRGPDGGGALTSSIASEALGTPALTFIGVTSAATQSTDLIPFATAAGLDSSSLNSGGPAVLFSYQGAVASAQDIVFSGPSIAGVGVQGVVNPLTLILPPH